MLKRYRTQLSEQVKRPATTSIKEISDENEKKLKPGRKTIEISSEEEEVKIPVRLPRKRIVISDDEEEVKLPVRTPRRRIEKPVEAEIKEGKQEIEEINLPRPDYVSSDDEKDEEELMEEEEIAEKLERVRKETLKAEKDKTKCDKFLEKAKMTEEGSKFLNPFTDQMIKKGSVHYKKYLNNCLNQILNFEEKKKVYESINPYEAIVGKRKIYSCQDIPKRKDKFNPQLHQIKVAERFDQIINDRKTEDDLRGILLYHGLGVGKTCEYALIIDTYLKRFPENYVFLFTPGSLRQNIIEQYCAFCGKNQEMFEKQFIFYTINDSLLINKLPQEITNALIIIDELHNLTHGKTNDSPTLSSLYNVIQRATNSFIVGGSGTPIESDVKELYWLSKLFYPGLYYNMDYFEDNFNEIDVPVEDIELERNLLKSFLTSKKFKVYIPKDESKFKNNICKFISYYMPEVNLNSEDFPRVEVNDIFVDMNPKRIEYAQALLEKELQLLIMQPSEKMKNKDPAAYKTLKTITFLSATHLKSSQFSNFWYPVIGERLQNIDTPDFGKPLDQNKKLEKILQDLNTQGNAPNLKIPDILKSKGGWITPEMIDDLDERGEKISVIINDIMNNEGKHAIYTRFKTYFGSRLIGTLLDIFDITYRFYDGDMTDDLRLKVLSDYNSEENDDGSQIKVIILTEAGAEGINLLSVRRYHILEQDVNMTKMKQVTGRANRYKSHSRLPKSQQTLTINNYIIKIGSKEETKFYSPDIICFESALKKDVSINEIKKVISSCAL